MQDLIHEYSSHEAFLIAPALPASNRGGSLLWFMAVTLPIIICPLLAGLRLLAPKASPPEFLAGQRAGLVFLQRLHIELLPDAVIDVPNKLPERFGVACIAASTLDAVACSRSSRTAFPIV